MAINSLTIFFLASNTSEPLPPPLTTVAVVAAASLMGMEGCLCSASLSSPSEGDVMEIVTAAPSPPSPPVPPFTVSLRAAAMLVL